jgi:hypothetical protein
MESETSFSLSALRGNYVKISYHRIAKKNDAHRSLSQNKIRPKKSNFESE